MSKLTSIVLVACALVSTGALAHFRIIEESESSYELLLGDVSSFPGSQVGTLIFRACPTCELRSLRVNADTRYFVDGAELALADFEAAVADIAAIQEPQGPTGVYIHYETATQDVNRIRVIQFRR